MWTCVNLALLYAWTWVFFNRFIYLKQHLSTIPNEIAPDIADDDDDVHNAHLRANCSGNDKVPLHIDEHDDSYEYGDRDEYEYRDD